jgi:hypothetical protein
VHEHIRVTTIDLNEAEARPTSPSIRTWAERALDHDIVHIRVRPSCLRYSDYRPGSFTVEETTLRH